MIGDAEDRLLDIVRRTLGAAVKTVDGLPGDWDMEQLKRLLPRAPAVYLAFLGGAARADEHVLRVDTRWGLYTLTAHAQGSRPRRRGDARQIGAYEMLARLLPAFHGETMSGIGTVSVERIDNLYTGLTDSYGVALYAAALLLPMPLPLPDPIGLADFETFHADYDIPPHEATAEHQKWLQEPPDHSTSHPDATDTVQLEQ